MEMKTSLKIWILLYSILYNIFWQVWSILPALESLPLNWSRCRDSNSDAGKMDQTWSTLYMIHERQIITHNSIIRHISCRSSNASCSLISFLWWSWFMMAISFLITCFSAALLTSTNLATKKRPVDRSIHLYTIPNDPLKWLQKNFFRQWSGNANCSS